MKKTIVFLIYLFGILSMTSCALFNMISGKVPAEIQTKEKRLFIVPFEVKTKDQVMKYYSSSMGRDLSSLIGQHIVNNVSSDIITDRSESLKSKIANHFKAPIWAEICQKEGLDFIVAGTIVEFRTAQKIDSNMLQGRMRVKLTVVDNKNRTLINEEEFQVLYPEPRSKDMNMSIGANALAVTHETIRSSLVHKMALKISQLFYAHEHAK